MEANLVSKTKVLAMDIPEDLHSDLLDLRRRGGHKSLGQMLREALEAFVAAEWVRIQSGRTNANHGQGTARPSRKPAPGNGRVPRMGRKAAAAR